MSGIAGFFIRLILDWLLRKAWISIEAYQRLKAKYSEIDVQAQSQAEKLKQAKEAKSDDEFDEKIRDSIS